MAMHVNESANVHYGYDVYPAYPPAQYPPVIPPPAPQPAQDRGLFPPPPPPPPPPPANYGPASTPSSECEKPGHSTRNRTVISKKQVEVLQAVFDVNPFPSKDIRTRLEKVTGLPMRVIRVWFQNRRREKKYKSKADPLMEPLLVPKTEPLAVIKTEPMEPKPEPIFLPKMEPTTTSLESRPTSLIVPKSEPQSE
ncbi:unnamed protein product [Acanthoscelides obtectus]|uniref:Homeobox domain-containing protein n=1 Tax=Acanthoscelides obtectus TaxID=200917 RepID=A0A9P0JZK3_ACAOB|nr:unnamed protein product [Acanthoscelides obtectus]CAK1669671.1 LIM/homeobox protein Lhx1 [Acanthoscelides obtectus]